MNIHLCYLEVCLVYPITHVDGLLLWKSAKGCGGRVVGRDLWQVKSIPMGSDITLIRGVGLMGVGVMVGIGDA